MSSVQALSRAPSAFASACVLSLLLSACAGSQQPLLGLDYRPAVIQKDLDSEQYEKDRSLCERQARQKATNYEPTNMVMFRQCLTDRGYKLIS